MILSFIIGAIALVGAVLLTISTTKEYSPAELEAFDKAEGIVHEEESSSLLNIFEDFKNMPQTMKQLGWVQFFRGSPCLGCGFLQLPQLRITFTIFR